MVIDKEMARLFELSEVEMEVVKVALRGVYGEVVMAEESRYSEPEKHTIRDEKTYGVRGFYLLNNSQKSCIKE